MPTTVTLKLQTAAARTRYIRMGTPKPPFSFTPTDTPPNAALCCVCATHPTAQSLDCAAIFKCPLTASCTNIEPRTATEIQFLPRAHPRSCTGPGVFPALPRSPE
ncbi:hypothetical protein FKM82_022260 [Ascaphus truei]